MERGLLDGGVLELLVHYDMQSGKLESGTDRGGPDKKTIPAGNRKSSSTKNLGLLEGFATASLSDQWFAPPVSGPSPRGRYKHGAAVVGDKMYINGGVHNGRHLDDLQVLDLKSWAWTRIEVKAGTDGTFASHSLIAWEGNKLLAVGRHVKDPLEIMQVKVFDLQTCSWSTLKIYGKPPVSRDGYSATLMGVSLIIFGGQDAKQSFSNNLHILDLETMNWGKVDTLGVPPSPRSDHVAAIHADRYFFVFGGCSHATCFNDLHVLDLQNKEWSRPAQKGEIPSPRAGHAGVTVGELWFIFGGGDHKRGVSQSVVLNMSTLVWSVIKRVQGFASLAREGLTSVLGSYNGEDVLVFFGGYDGQYTNQVDLAKL
ncbi:unnamed protein product [Coffea canephora]|uniref:DH200=94 genomic scaffold, scaffold_516 n=1 Tax=Coffea canephora TaxID=49390 RepID=A0A068VFJ1_COFCA|nr:unnamed protein product [Coffea canephora]